jgi:BirA family biotin operon repressor/biotin-[acetyl-CoA-carboxylase] ligase
MLFRPASVPVARWPWLPLLAGVAVVEALRAETGVPAGLKWPNDVVVDGLKLAGLLAEVVPECGGGVVVGVGLNVTAVRPDLPLTATSLALCGAADLDRVQVLAAVLRSVAHQYAGWCTSGGDPGAVRRAYRPLCTTLGAQVRVQLPAGGPLTGRATDVDDDGRLVVRTADGDRALSIGDVVHVR